MKRLLIVFTGGTIGSRSAGGEIQVNEAGSYALLDAYNASDWKRNDVAMDTIQPLNILSENMTPNHWSTLSAAIKEADWNAFAGIIVTHGSDTLAYTAAMFSYLFADITIPLVFTASNYPLADERSNGLSNFGHSIDYIMDSGLPGVFVVYANDQAEPIVYLGTRITQCEPFTDQFRCPYDIPYGKMTNRRFEWLAHEFNPSPEKLRGRESAGLAAWKPESLVIDSSIVYVKPYPGLNYSYYRFGDGDERPKAILHDLHHSGTACAADDGPYSLTRFIEACRAQNIDVYLCPIKDSSDSLYSSSLKLIEAGAIVIEKLSVEAALTKLMLGWGLYGEAADGRDSVKSFVTGTSIFYERNEACDDY
ncbi:asparaginase [Paenibacillus harenae]|uniref:asparaginase n=1 Tax=Paenibacillus harenae TaxID=306543 RepID=A0ABT9U1L1_PAEHA|nr:asparaginase domain-containing protein [Paenibacillus harenae]MDQ0113524.1 L-asparaginase [Paenibacillus harenae]